MSCVDPADLESAGVYLFCGNAVRLRGVRNSDLPDLTEWLVDPHIVVTGLSSLLPKSEAAAASYFEQTLRNDEPFSRIGYVVETLTEAGHPVGFVNLHEISFIERSAKVSVVIGRAHQGCGYGTDALRVLQRYAFEYLQLHRLEIEVFAFNRRALDLYKRLGYMEEGRRREVVLRAGRRHDSVLMSLLASDLPEVQPVVRCD